MRDLTKLKAFELADEVADIPGNRMVPQGKDILVDFPDFV